MKHTVLLLLPAFFTMLWVFYLKARQRKFMDFLMLLACSSALCVNCIMVQQMMSENISTMLHLVQMTAASMVIPLGYLYFSEHTGGLVSSSLITSIALWVLFFFTYVPQIIIRNPFEPFAIPEGGLQPFAFYVLSHGQKVFAIYTGDLAVILQCIVVLARVIIFMYALREHKLHLNRGMYFFGAYWIVAAILAIILSTMTSEDLRSSMGEWLYFGVYAIMLTSFNTLLIKGYDLNAVETENGDVVEDIDHYVQHQYGEMALRMRRMMEEEQLYTDPQLTAERVTELLHTNHTYFSQMMSSEWGVSFSDYLGQLRMAKVESLLPDSSLTISNIAQLCGFSDAGYMSRKFKAKHGMTPSEWRKQRLKSTKN